MIVNKLLSIAILGCLLVATRGEQTPRRLTLQPGMTLNITAGTPAQQFTVLFNTASANTWLVGEKCQLDFCQRQRRFKSSQSSTNIADGRRWQTDFGMGATFEGKLSRDSLGFAGHETIVEGQLIGELSGAQGWMLDYIKLDGVLGLGSRQAVSLNTLDPVQSMFRQALIPQQLFALYVTKNPDDDEPTGEVMLGGIDESHYSGQITYVDAINRWTFVLDYVTVPNFDIQFSRRDPALIDSTSNVIFAPPAAYSSIAAAFEMRLNQDLGLPEFDSCSQVPDKQFELLVDGTKLTLTARDLLMKVQYGFTVTCYLALKLNVDDGWVLGTPFLRKYYTVFDHSNRRLGFALSK